MTFEKLYRLFSIKAQSRMWMAWDEYWDALYAEGYINIDSESKPPELTQRGTQAIDFAVKKAGEV